LLRSVHCLRCVRIAPRFSVQESMPENRIQPKVLVVDDERVIADTLAMILNQSGFEARAVYSGEKALEMASTFAPDMLITDVIMADLNGIDAAIRIRELLPQIKVLLFSGQAATADLLEKARAQGYEFEILAKPVHPQDLLSKLRS
jgi:CheY-like chemotaxis protein